MPQATVPPICIDYRVGRDDGRPSVHRMRIIRIVSAMSAAYVVVGLILLFLAAVLW